MTQSSGGAGTARLKREMAAGHALRTAVWEQEHDGIPLWDGVLIAHTTPQGELVSMSSRGRTRPFAVTVLSLTCLEADHSGGIQTGRILWRPLFVPPFLTKGRGMKTPYGQETGLKKPSKAAK